MEINLYLSFTDISINRYGRLNSDNTGMIYIESVRICLNAYLCKIFYY